MAAEIEGKGEDAAGEAAPSVRRTLPARDFCDSAVFEVERESRPSRSPPDEVRSTRSAKHRGTRVLPLASRAYRLIRHGCIPSSPWKGEIIYMATNPKPGSVAHLEIRSTDPEKTKAFYNRVFGWKFQDMPAMNYTMWEAPSGMGGGLKARKPASGHPDVHPVEGYQRGPAEDFCRRRKRPHDEDGDPADGMVRDLQRSHGHGQRAVRVQAPEDAGRAEEAEDLEGEAQPQESQGRPQAPPLTSSGEARPAVILAARARR